MNTKTKAILLGIILVGLLIGFAWGAPESRLTTLLTHFNLIKVEQHASYGGLSYEQLINRADVVFVGKLLSISPSRWNQDSGEYWSDESSPRVATPLQFHTLQFDVSKFIIDKIGAKDQKTIEVVVIGPSPLDGNADYSLATDTNVRWVRLFRVGKGVS